MTWQSWVWLIIADVVIAIAIGKLLKHAGAQYERPER